MDNKIIIEIRPGEGGLDSMDLIGIQSGIYHKFASKQNY